MGAKSQSGVRFVDLRSISLIFLKYPNKNVKNNFVSKGESSELHDPPTGFATGIHHANMSVCFIPPYTHFYMVQGNALFSCFALKHIL